jgi:hypothetical protein
MRGWLLTGARRLALLAAFGLALAGALMTLNTPYARADGGAGVVAGALTNGTYGTHGMPVAGQKVALQLVIGSSIRDLATTTTSASGAFSFSGVDATPAALDGQWAVYTSYQGGMYSSAPLTVQADKTVDASFVVYDATQDSSHLRVSLATILVREPDVTHGLVNVAEFITIQNTGKTAFVGQAPNGTAATMPPLLRFALPANAINLVPSVGFANTQIIQVDSGFAATATVPPGSSAFTFAFQVPYTGTTLALPFKAVYPAQQVVALVPPDMLAHDSGAGFKAQGIVNSFGSRYQLYSSTSIATNGQLTLDLYQLPRAGERQDLNTAALYWLAAALLALLALLIGLYLWRGALGAALGLVPAPGASPASMFAADAGVERKRLLEALLDLERRHARGDLSDERFKREDATARQRLRDLLVGGSDAVEAGADALVASGEGAEAQAEAAEPAPPSGRGGAQ